MVATTDTKNGINSGSVEIVPSSLPIDERLAKLRALREELTDAIKEKINKLVHERDGMTQEYNEEIARLEGELGACGVRTNTTAIPSDLSVKAYNYMREHPGIRYTSGELMTAIRAVGAVASVVLSPMLDDGRVLVEGYRRSARYYVPGEIPNE